MSGYVADGRAEVLLAQERVRVREQVCARIRRLLSKPCGRQVLLVLAGAPGPLTQSQIADLTDFSYSSVGRALGRGVVGDLVDQRRGYPHVPVGVSVWTLTDSGREFAATLAAEGQQP